MTVQAKFYYALCLLKFCSRVNSYVLIEMVCKLRPSDVLCYVIQF